ncbi:carboxymuconolactone decarboxylase family protein [Amycolatopsis rhabdoformis]|uniref:Carboxymuconolactone decarboxylase family protein n=1 Tax=Amycolatopsis rhabdoformis TaxID=1448059 RepID=A0ABZ1IJN3_9PSEU|nr:carboxymuconolactone decarboxylase family protein [Amycolatopsis rhabdoformis]WSE34679.1 carboxymuconolactone decarboxylase family protein [Amycolatopsis rhabdoformis]
MSDLVFDFGGPSRLHEVMTYHDPADMKFMAALKKLAPVEFEKFMDYQEVVSREDGEIPRRYREMIAIAVALTTQCAYCLDVHTAAGREQGMTAEELAETALIAGAVRGGGAVAHGLLAMKLYEDGGTHPSLR